MDSGVAAFLFRAIAKFLRLEITHESLKKADQEQLAHGLRRVPGHPEMLCRQFPSPATLNMTRVRARTTQRGAWSGFLRFHSNAKRAA